MDVPNVESIWWHAALRSAVPIISTDYDNLYYLCHNFWVTTVKSKATKKIPYLPKNAYKNLIREYS